VGGGVVGVDFVRDWVVVGGGMRVSGWLVVSIGWGYY